MKRLAWTTTSLLIAAACAVSVAGAQSLAELAKKEKERRAELGPDRSRKITDTELRTPQSGQPITSSTALTSTPANGDEDATTTQADGAGGPDTTPQQTASYWRERVRAADDRIRTLEEDLGSPAYTMDPRGARRRQRLEAELDRARQERENIFEEARRENVPPGWLR